MAQVRAHTIEDDGERMIPEFHHDAVVYAEHMVRYLFASRFVAGKTVLDVASGVGYGSDMLKAAGAAQVIGIDRSTEAITYGQEHHSALGSEYLLADAGSLPLRDRQLDVVVSFETIEHVLDYRLFLTEIQRVLRRGGLLIISTPNKLTFPEGNPYHTKEFTFTELKEALTTRFEHIGMFPQDNWITSAILSPSTMERADEPIGGNAKIFKTVGRPAEKTLYIVALCSDAPLPKVSQQVAMTDIAELERYVEEIGRIGADVHRLSSDVAERDAALAGKDAALADKDAALADKDAALAHKDAALADKDAALAQRQEALEQTTQELITFRQSLGYRILEGYRRRIRWLFPPNSHRGLPYRALRRLVRWLAKRR
ncbi:MAG: class I SAM-dependent methyltransferase [Chloroflexi bacterium]|nr:class I SAM-dependent methyltransferase [Chloroflexota bacterium]